MAMQAATVEILIEKAKFEPRVAVAIAEAMDAALDGKARHLQLVTLPMLDERLTALRGKLEEKIENKISGLQTHIGGLQGEIGKQDAKVQSIKSDLMRFVLLAVMSLFTMITGVMYFMLQQLR